MVFLIPGRVTTSTSQPRSTNQASDPETSWTSRTRSSGQLWCKTESSEPVRVFVSSGVCGQVEVKTSWSRVWLCVQDAHLVPQLEGVTAQGGLPTAPGRGLSHPGSKVRSREVSHEPLLSSFSSFDSTLLCLCVPLFWCCHCLLLLQRNWKRNHAAFLPHNWAWPFFFYWFLSTILLFLNVKLNVEYEYCRYCMCIYCKHT